jgi:hypothetical protein
MEIQSADDACPLCASSITDHGQYAGTWDGALGAGFGNWYLAQCPNCSSKIVGWEYIATTTNELHIKWEAVRDSEKSSMQPSDQ